MTKSSKITFAIITIAWFLLSSNQKNWSRNQVKADVVSYYSYLPAFFIDKDLKLTFLDSPNTPHSGLYWAEQTPDGKHVIKTTMGLSILYLPFFAIAHYIVAPLGGYLRNGYTEAYMACLAAGSFVYLLLGLLFLRKTLLKFYSEKITLWVIISIFFGTNLLWYSYGEALMPHQFVFSLVSFLIYFTIQWYQTPTIKTSIILSIICGMIILVRPGDMLLCLFPLLYGAPNKNYFKEKITIVKQNFWKIILILTIIIIIQLPQLLYWKTVTGSWFYNSYTGERFYFNHPHIIEGLFGYRKGWLLYTPMMGFSIIGLFMLKNNAKKLLLAIALILPLFIYILFCWWSWWYGGSFGMRPFIDIYAMLAIPMGASFTFLMKTKIRKIITTTIISFFILLNMLQIYQYNNFILHFEAMTKESYWYVFGKVEKPDNWWAKLRLPYPIRSTKGLPEAYTKQQLLQGSYILRAANNKLINADSAGAIIETENYSWNVAEHYTFINTSNNKIILLATNQKYVSVNNKNNLVATSESKENATEFELTLLEDNKIELSAGDFKKMVRVYMGQ